MWYKIKYIKIIKKKLEETQQENSLEKLQWIKKTSTEISIISMNVLWCKGFFLYDVPKSNSCQQFYFTVVFETFLNLKHFFPFSLSNLMLLNYYILCTTSSRSHIIFINKSSAKKNYNIIHIRKVERELFAIVRQNSGKAGSFYRRL